MNMNVSTLFLGILVVGCTGQTAQQYKGEGPVQHKTIPTAMSGDCSGDNHLDIVFYNVENLFDTDNDSKTEDDDFTPEGKYEWSDGRYEKKLKNLSKVFQSMDHGAGEAAIIGLAEVENKAVVEDLGNMIIPNGYDVVHGESPDRRGIDVALLYRKDMVKKLDEDFIKIEFSDRGYTSRDILYFKGQIGDDIVHVFVNHWPSRREGQQETEHRRLDAAKTLKKRIDKIKSDDKNAQFILLGDFNDYPDNKSLTNVLNAKSENGKKDGELVNLAYELEMKGKAPIHTRAIGVCSTKV